MKVGARKARAAMRVGALGASRAIVVRLALRWASEPQVGPLAQGGQVRSRSTAREKEWLVGPGYGPLAQRCRNEDIGRGSRIGMSS
jgi:hypothetical protein